ncbi:MAG: hypothetical protein Q8L54_06120 [Devosia sp.]|nr:hypothetical protein [Devosia sp.]
MADTTQTCKPAGQGEPKRELGVFGATMMGMGGAIVGGTGVFASIGITAGLA